MERLSRCVDASLPAPRAVTVKKRKANIDFWRKLPIMANGKASYIDKNYLASLVFIVLINTRDAR